MPELTIENIEKIKNHISREEITIPGLLDELIDHVCCDIEFEMDSGLSFEDSFRNVTGKIGKGRFREIQEETLYAIDSKYRKMKNIMKISGTAGTILLGFAALFKIQHWPGAGVALTLGSFILAFLFLPSSLGVLWKETHNFRKVILFVSGFFAALFFILGTLFKIQHWPGAGLILLLAIISALALFLPALLIFLLSDPERKAKRIPYIAGMLGLILYLLGFFFKINHWPLAAYMLLSGFFMVIAVAIPWYAYITWKEEEHIRSKFLYIVIASLLFIIPGTMINLNLQYSYEKNFDTFLGRQQVLNDYLANSNASLVSEYTDSSFYPLISTIHDRTTSLASAVRSVGIKMINDSENRSGNTVSPQIQMVENGPKINNFNTSFHGAFNKEPVRIYLSPGSDTRKMLEAEFSGYLAYVSSLPVWTDIEKYSGLLDISKYLPGQSEIDYAESVMPGLHCMENLGNNLLFFERQVIFALIRNGDN